MYTVSVPKNVKMPPPSDGKFLRPISQRIDLLPLNMGTFNNKKLPRDTRIINTGVVILKTVVFILLHTVFGADDSGRAV
jgi:hypothetical protein